MITRDVMSVNWPARSAGHNGYIGFRLRILVEREPIGDIKGRVTASSQPQSSRSSTVLRSAPKMALTHIRGKVARPEGRHRAIAVRFLVETLGLMVNPLTRELLPMRLMLAGTGVNPELEPSSST